jgi:cyclic beta-1,2-glucan synthetase
MREPNRSGVSGAPSPSERPVPRSAETIPPAQLFSVNQLGQLARALAEKHELAPGIRWKTDRLLSRLRENEAALKAAHALLTEAVKRGRRVTPAAEWLIDNYHLIEEQIRTARRHLPPGYNRELPRLARAGETSVPRVYDLALELISHSHGRLDIEGLRAFVVSYQTVKTLRLGELWAIPIMLRLALIENLRRVVASVTEGRNDREDAGRWVDRMIQTAQTAPARVVLVLAEMVRASPPLTNPFAAELASRLQGHAQLLFAMSWVEQRLAERGETVEHVFQLVSQSQAADQVSIGNCIGSLRLLGATDWRVFVEDMSAVEKRLADDPAGAYLAMDFATRDRYRHVVEEVARCSRSSEEQVADAALMLARDGVERRRHVGYFLIGAGRPELERAAKMRLPISLRFRRGASRARYAVYAGSILALTAVGAITLLQVANHCGLPRAWRPGAVLLFAFICSQLAIAIVHLCATLVAHPRLLPRLDFSKGIPAEHQTAVAVPALLIDAGEVDGLLESLEIRYLANRDPNLSFVLVTDFRDAAAERIDGDEVLLQRAREGVLALNDRYAARGSVPPFYLLHRRRRWNQSQGVWMGWERKRGKLEQLNQALRGKADSFDTTVGDLALLQSVRYVIVLDSDTQLPRDAARLLAGTLAHPLNRPRFDERANRFTEGYAILRRDHHGERAQIPLRPALLRRAGHRPVHARRLQRLPRRVRRGVVRRQRHLRRRRVSARDQRPAPGEPDLEPRSPRGRLRARGPGQRRAALRRSPVRLRGGSEPPPPLDARRLADPRLAAQQSPGREPR